MEGKRCSITILRWCHCADENGQGRNNGERTGARHVEKRHTVRDPFLLSVLIFIIYRFRLWDGRKWHQGRTQKRMWLSSDYLETVGNKRYKVDNENEEESVGLHLQGLISYTDDNAGQYHHAWRKGLKRLRRGFIEEFWKYHGHVTIEEILKKLGTIWRLANDQKQTESLKRYEK